MIIYIIIITFKMKIKMMIIIFLDSYHHEDCVSGG